MSYEKSRFAVCLLLTVIVLSSFVESHGYPEYIHIVDWKFTLDPDWTHVEMLMTIYPLNSFYESSIASPVPVYNVTAYDFTLAKSLETKIEEEAGLTIMTVKFRNPKSSLYKFVLSYYIKPDSSYGGGENYDYFSWNFGDAKIPVSRTAAKALGEDYEYYTSPQNVTIVFPQEHVFDKATQKVDGITEDLKVNIEEEDGREICKFSGIAPEKGYFDWTVFYKSISETQTVEPSTTISPTETTTTTTVTPIPTETPISPPATTQQTTTTADTPSSFVSLLITDYMPYYIISAAIICAGALMAAAIYRKSKK